MSSPVWKISDGRWSRRPLAVLFWASTALLAAGLATVDPLVGLLLVTIPLGLVALVRHWGLGGIPTAVFVAVIVASLVPAGLVLGDYRTGAGQFAIVLLIFLVWVLAYPTMVRQMDRQYLREHLSFPDGSVPREPLAEFRVQVITLWLTVMIMLLVGELLVAAFVAFALLRRRRWTAVIAALACLVLPLVTVRLDGVVWDTQPLVVLAALVAAHQWTVALGNPLWAGGQVRAAG